jgi:hypothetical protein
MTKIKNVNCTAYFAAINLMPLSFPISEKELSLAATAYKAAVRSNHPDQAKSEDTNIHIILASRKDCTVTSLKELARGVNVEFQKNTYTSQGKEINYNDFESISAEYASIQKRGKSLKLNSQVKDEKVSDATKVENIKEWGFIDSTSKALCSVPGLGTLAGLIIECEEKELN